MSEELIKVAGKDKWRFLERMRQFRPRTKRQLAAYIQAFLGLKIPAQRICEGHDSPLDYLAYAFLGKAGKDNSAGSAEGAGHDCIVWANRGGGKTQLGAVASLLEGVFLPGCQIRILGGSQEQSRRMYEYLRSALEHGFTHHLSGKITATGCRFVSGAAVQVLAQSDRSVRGHHVQRLRCDEVELFDRDIWQGCQFVTQSKGDIPGRLEVFSTMHRPFGLMHEIINSAGKNSMRLFRWCLWEVIEKCRDRSCSSCPLAEDCQGLARTANGYYAIDDAIAQKQRSSAAAWKAEMLCREPSREDAVFPEFSPARHVRRLNYNSDLPLYRAIDFGFSNPLACLFIQVDKADRVLVIDEHLKSRTTLAEHARLIKERFPYPVEATYCDPAGRQRHEITGTAVTCELAALGIPTRCRSSRILDGIELIRNFLAPAYGESRLVIADRCENLIRSFAALRYSKGPNGVYSELPEKDGIHDHIIDALRYFFVNRFARKYQLRIRKY